MSEMFGITINEILTGKRLTVEEYKQAAEENLAQTIKASSFTLKDRIDYFKKKWLKEHIAILLLVFGHGWRNNTMMTYVENNAYDGSGK